MHADSARPVLLAIICSSKLYAWSRHYSLAAAGQAHQGLRDQALLGAVHGGHQALSGDWLHRPKVVPPVQQGQGGGQGRCPRVQAHVRPCVPDLLYSTSAHHGLVVPLCARAEAVLKACASKHVQLKRSDCQTLPSCRVWELHESNVNSLLDVVQVHEPAHGHHWHPEADAKPLQAS